MSVKLKLFRVELQKDGTDTAVIYHASGRKRTGVVQQNATWRCRWRLADGDGKARLTRIQVIDYEEIIPVGDVVTLFSDCTSAVFGNDVTFGEHLVFGIDHWRRQLESSLDPDLSGLQGIAIGDVNGDGRDDVYVCQQGETADHIDRILTRVTLIGALYMSAVCVLPTLLAVRSGVPFFFGGTALLIVVGVGLDTIAQIEAHLVSRQYEGFVQGTRIRGRLSR